VSQWLEQALAILAEDIPAFAATPPVETSETPQGETVGKVTAVSTVSTRPLSADSEERAAIIEYGGRVPRDWAEGLARLLSSPPPAGVLPSLWRVRVDRGVRFYNAWAAHAAACGWSDSDLFGLHPTAPLSRYDGMGAAFLGFGWRGDGRDA
jgi:hypothetical protein